MSTALCTRPDVEARHVAVPSPSEEELAVLATAAPMMPRAEYLTAEVLDALWEAIGAAFTAEQAESRATVQEFLKRLNPAWNVVGRVHFHVAEKPRGRRGALRRPCHLHVAAYREALDLFRALPAESVGVASGLSALAEAERVRGSRRGGAGLSRGAAGGTSGR
jgi:hypothetical protein